MKKNLFFHFSVLAMLIVLISACSSKKPEYTNVIPSDASQVIAVNLKSLADKAGTKDKETKEALQKLTDALKSDMNAATFQQLEAVLKDPAKSGVDVNAPIYVFNVLSFPYTTTFTRSNRPSRPTTHSSSVKPYRARTSILPSESNRKRSVSTPPKIICSRSAGTCIFSAKCRTITELVATTASATRVCKIRLGRFPLGCR